MSGAEQIRFLLKSPFLSLYYFVMSFRNELFFKLTFSNYGNLMCLVSISSIQHEQGAKTLNAINVISLFINFTQNYHPNLLTDTTNGSDLSFRYVIIVN